ncbi:hypothetical protein BJ944DRAFT_270679 [Cunninghamella echinulata]|nr:hypothetical protein BJ944DRAFT_270679 [Cunninghamella echinulata]
MNEVKRRKSEESLRSTTPTLRRVQSLKHYHYKQNNNNNNNNNNINNNINNNNNKSAPMCGKDNQHDLFIQSNLESTSSITLVTSPNSQLLKRSSSFDSPSKLSLIIEEDEKKSMSTTTTTTTTHNNNQEPIKTSQSLNLPKEKNHNQMLSKNKWNTIGNTPLQRSLAYFSTEASPSPPLHPSLQIPTAPTLNHLDHYQIGHVNSSTISLQNQHNYNHHQNSSSTYIVSVPSSLSQQQNNHQPLTSISIHDQLNDELGFDTNITTSTDQIQPYLRLYASKQNSKTLSHIWKNSSLKFLRKNKK